MSADRFEYEFEYFIEVINNAYVYCYDLVDYVNRFYSIELFKSLEIEDRKNLENSLFYLDEILQNLSNIKEKFYEIDFPQLYFSTVKETKEKNNVLIFPLYEDEDMLVDITNPLSIDFHNL